MLGIKWMSLTPTTNGILVEIVAGLNRLVHVDKIDAL
jgi:hypothetical protein